MPIDDVSGPTEVGGEPPRYDAIVVGTGFGGAVAAARLADAIEAVDADGAPRYPALRTALVLERGRKYAPGDFPRPPLPKVYPGEGADAEAMTFDGAGGSLWWPLDGGLWDVRPLSDLLVVQAAGYGGGSLIYANVQMKPADTLLTERWGLGAEAVAELRDGYALGAWRLGARPCPDGLPKSAGFRAALPGWSAQTFAPRLAVHFGDGATADACEPGVPQSDHQGAMRPACTFCGACDLGCNVGAKNTLDLTYLARAEAAAAMEIRTQCEVFSVRPADAEPGAYLVEWWDHLVGGARRQAITSRLFLCAGAVNSTELLLRTRGQFGPLGPGSGLREGGPLGERVWANGDAIAGVFRTRARVEASRGPVITSAVVAREPGPGGQWIMAQDAGVPRAMMPFLRWFSGPLRPLTGPAPRAGARTGTVDAGLLHSLLRHAPVAAGATPPETTVGRLQRFAADLVATGADAVDEGVSAAVDVTATVVAERMPGIIGRLLGRWVRAGAEGALDEAFVDRLVARLTTLVSQRALDLARFDVEDDHMQPILLMGHDPVPGRLRLEGGSPDGAAVIDWPTEANRPFYDAQARLLREMAAGHDGVLRSNPLWQVTGTPLSVHVLGGCHLGQGPDEGVVDAHGEVFGHPGLVVLDAAVFPHSVGANPSATIVAFAERAMAHHITQTRPEAPFEAPELALARAWFEAYPEPLEAVEAAPARMPDARATVGLTFDERMIGYVTPVAHLRRADPARRAQIGARLGPQRGQRVVAELHVVVADLDAFVAGADREAALSGEIRLDGVPCRVLAGTLGLLPRAAAGERDRAEMNYAVHFERPDGQVWVLRGRKTLRDDPGQDLLRDTTELAVSLAPAGGAPEAYGALKVHLDDLLDYQLPSFDVTGVHPDDLGGQLMVLGRFVRFFLGRLAQVYVRSAIEMLAARPGGPDV